MNENELTELRDYYDRHDQSAALQIAESDASSTDNPMVGITIRLPAAVLNAARIAADSRGIKVTALLREWIELSLAEQAEDRRVVPVAELRRLIAAAS